MSGSRKSCRAGRRSLSIMPCSCAISRTPIAAKTNSSPCSLTVVVPPMPLAVRGDATRLSQVLSNLLNNAAKYTPDGGRIDLLVECEGADVVFRVRDNGPGIAPELLSKIFDLFTQVDRSLD